MSPKLEIACFNLESALIAAKAGADRLELCANFNEGGTTPDLEMVKMAKQNLSIPLYVMIRPRGGNFVYTNAEFEHMKTEISFLKSLNIDGFVFGILNENNKIDIIRNSELITLASPIPCTFHRAFDRTSNFKEALENIIFCGFKTILTSGLAKNTVEGLHKLAELIKLASDRIVIMPGGGVRSTNISEITEKTNAVFYHSSAILNNGDVADENEIKALKSQIG